MIKESTFNLGEIRWKLGDGAAERNFIRSFLIETALSYGKTVKAFAPNGKVASIRNNITVIYPKFPENLLPEVALFNQNIVAFKGEMYTADEFRDMYPIHILSKPLDMYEIENVISQNLVVLSDPSYGLNRLKVLKATYEPYDIQEKKLILKITIKEVE